MTQPLRLSFSSLNLFHSCERKFQLIKLLDAGFSKEESADLSFGAAYGVGVASYIQYQDPDLAIFQAWLAFYPQIETEKKNQWNCISALLASFSYLDDLLQEYELAFFDKKPAAELGYRLDIEKGYYFVGWIDVVLRHRFSGQYVIFECKTTGSKLTDLTPMYKNSGQALGYSIILDQIAGEKVASYGVLYFVCQLMSPWSFKVQTLSFDKTLLDRLNWFLSLGIDIKNLKYLREINVFPMRGNHCLSFNRPCPLFGTCDLHSMDKPAQEVEDTENYQFTYKLEDVIQDHLRRLTPC